MTLAHAPALIGPPELWSSWVFDSRVIATLLVVGFLYAGGVRRGRRVPRRRFAAFWGALIVLVFALISPLDALAETLFSAHMFQHLLLVAVAAPLLVYSDPLLPMFLALPIALRRTIQRLGRLSTMKTFLLAAPVAVTLHAVVMWAWHLPSLYQAALTNEELHAVEHVCFLGSALLFWSAVIPTQRHRRAHGPRIAIVFANLLQSGALGALLLFATVVLYPLHRAGADLWGVRPLADQQLAGVIMWVPAGGIYFVTMAVLFARWLRVFEMRTGDAGAHRHA